MTELKLPLEEEIARLERKIDRERRAREEAERLLEEKSSMLFDVNQKLEAEAQHARLLVTAIESASDGVAITDANGLFTFMNKSHAVMFGYKVEELLGQPWSLLYEPTELRRFERQIMPKFEQFGFWRGETIGCAQNGDRVLQEVVLTGLPNGGLICATRDIALRRRAQIRAREMEQRLQKAEQEAALFTLGNAVAHDFNNLIGAISGYAMLIKSEVVTDSQAASYAERIGQAADQAAGVIRSLEIERSNDTQTLDDVDLAALGQTGLSIAEAIRPPGILLDIEIPDTAVVRVNEVAVSRCLLNITKNAFDAMGQEGELFFRIGKTPSERFQNPTSYFSLGEAEEAYDWIVEIGDTGPGLRQEKLERIFDPYYTSKPSLKGSGLGLLSLTALVQSNSAFVEVISQLDKGTLFRLNMKASEKRANNLKISAPLEVRSEQITKPHILIVEDEVMMGEVIAKTLEKLGYAYDLRHHPLEALALIEDNAYTTDLVLTDLNMPKLQGDELTSRIKTVRPDLPVIIYSGQAGYILPDSKYAAILRKPIAAEALNIALQSAFESA